VRIALDPTLRLLTVTVEDDERGLVTGRRSGVGLQSMRERAEELGGTCAIEPRPGGGTRVLATLPYHSPEDGEQEERA